MAHQHGDALNIIKFGDSNKIEFDRNSLELLLLHPEVKDRNITLVSIVGAFRRGKSFFADYLLRFLYGNVRNSIDLWLSIKIFF